MIKDPLQKSSMFCSLLHDRLLAFFLLWVCGTDLDLWCFLLGPDFPLVDDFPPQDPQVLLARLFMFTEKKDNISGEPYHILTKLPWVLGAQFVASDLLGEV